MKNTCYIDKGKVFVIRTLTVFYCLILTLFIHKIKRPFRLLLSSSKSTSATASGKFVHKCGLIIIIIIILIRILLLLLIYSSFLVKSHSFLC